MSLSSFPFAIVHADTRTSWVLSFTGFKYYLVLIDDYSNYIWTYPLHHKYDVFYHFVQFHNMVQTQFSTPTKTIQCDNGGEFQNHNFTSFWTTHGILPRFYCPYTSQQNGHAERLIRTITNMIRSLLFKAHCSLAFEALHVATHLINLLPPKTSSSSHPPWVLFRPPPSYTHLHIFGCLCYPNLTSTTPHKLAPCLFLGYPAHHRGYRCRKPARGKISSLVTSYLMSLPSL